MSKRSSAFLTFLDQKYIPLSSKAKIGIAAIIVLIPLAAYFFLYFQPNLDKIKTLTANKEKSNKELNDVKTKASNLPKFEKEFEEANIIFNETSLLLPKDSEIPKLLTDISALGRTAGLDFLTFKPGADIPKDFYAEIPVAINVKGPYHNMGFFFDQVSKLERIVSVSNIKMSGPKKEADEMVLTSDCTLVTYRFTGVELPKDPKKNPNPKAAKQPPPAKQAAKP